MKTVDAFKLILKIEDLYNTNIFSWKGLGTWPLIRKIIWFRLISTSHSYKYKKVKHDLNVGSKYYPCFLYLKRQKSIIK